MNTISDELLPCPFCGGRPSPTAHLEYSWFAPVCKSCGVSGPTVRIERGLELHKLRELMSKADALWNTRADAVRAREQSVTERQPLSAMTLRNTLLIVADKWRTRGGESHDCGEWLRQFVTEHIPAVTEREQAEQPEFTASMYGSAAAAKKAQEAAQPSGSAVDEIVNEIRAMASKKDCQIRLDRVAHIAKKIAALRTPSPAQVPEGIDAEIFAEIERAIRKFPTWPTDPLHALAVLGEEFGELTKAVLQSAYEPHKSTPDDVKGEAIQTAAMALRFCRSLHRYAYARCAQHAQESAAPTPQSAEK